jgi:hypothetical protein
MNNLTTINELYVKTIMFIVVECMNIWSRQEMANHANFYEKNLRVSV